MDAMNEKKWFVYLEDHHEGPFSVSEIQSKLTQNAVRKEHYVWCEGMQDWKPMTEVQDFSMSQLPPGALGNGAGAVSDLSLLSAEVSIEGHESVSLQSTMDAPLHSAMEMEKTPSLSASTSGSEMAPIIMTEMPYSSSEDGGLSSSMPAMAVLSESDSTEKSSPGAMTQENIKLVQDQVTTRGGLTGWKKFRRPLLVLLVLGGLGFAFTQGYLDSVLQNPQIKEMTGSVSGKISEWTQPLASWVSDKIPFLGQYLSPLPPLPELSGPDYGELKTTAQTSVASAGPQAAVVVLGRTSSSPTLYVSANLPDGANITVHVEGISETLLNASEYTKKTPLTLKSKFSKTAPLTQEGGQPLPRGSYNIYVYENDQQPEDVKAIFDQVPAYAKTSLPRVLAQGKKLGTSKKVFMGGEEDTVYQERLKDYHTRVRERAQQDHNELSQVTQTLVKQYNDAYSLFDSLKAKNEAKLKTKKPSQSGSVDPGVLKTWKEKTGLWVKFQTQINQFEKWTPEYIQGAFYAQLYDQVRKASSVLISMQEKQDQYFTQSIEPQAYEAQLSESRNQAKTLISELLIKIKKVETSLKESQGLPPKLD